MYYIKLASILLGAIVLWIAFVFYAGFLGWWMTPIANPGDTEGFYQQALRLIEENNKGNAALLLIEDGKVTREFYSNSTDTINRDTVFAAASMSKWITAIGVMKLVEAGKLELDRPVNEYLSRWNIPASQFDISKVTARRLLSHTAGMTDGLGFGDYASDELLPTLEESLNNPRASSDRKVELKVTMEPGKDFQYSGGSYLILELLVEEISGQAFEDYMEQTVFAPLDMTRSGYSFIGDVKNNSGSFGSDGQPAPLYQYASKAATGFVTSTSDLSKLVLSQLPVSAHNQLLKNHTARSMRVPHGQTFGVDIWGLGTILYAPTQTDDFVFGHDGANDPAINAAARINPSSRDAIIVLETGHPSLATNIGSHWVFWQTGYPDALDSNAVARSMKLPAVVGVIFILLLLLGVHFLLRSKGEAK